MKNKTINFKKFYQNKQSSIIKLFKKTNFSNNFNELLNNGISTIKNGNKIIIFGNGGSAADAQHLATELTVRFEKNRKAMAAIALTTDTSALTAIGNDFSFKYIFSRQMEAIGQEGDLCIAITTSGNSQNLIEAIKAANKKNISTYCFSGNGGGKLKEYCHRAILIPSKNTAEIQVIEIFIGQLFCSVLEEYCC
jgi:D-sedoheptulose 7-phosphate isomerase